MRKYEHISFKKNWEVSPRLFFILGKCAAHCESLNQIPLFPEIRENLQRMSFIKGAQATTAIEGNTLNEFEIDQLNSGWSPPKSKEYLAIEVKNVLDAFNQLLEEVVRENKTAPITSRLIRDFHQMVGRNLGDHFDACPGKFREDNRVVGGYRAPDYQNIPELIEKFCNWIEKQFQYDKDSPFYFHEIFIQAIVAHVYLEWIHPFGDGNGRTGRLLEFFILLRGGISPLASHMLSNFYNETRMKYYRQLDNARKKNNLDDFIQYAINGFYDQLQYDLNEIYDGQFKIIWKNFIYERFSNITMNKRTVFKRKRDLILNFPLFSELSINDILKLNPEIAKDYVNLKRLTLSRDLQELVDLGLLKKYGRKYTTNTDIMLQN